MLAAMVAPSMTGTLGRVRLDAAAAAVRTAWVDARLEAMRSGEPFTFQCQLGTGQYTVSKLIDATAATALTEEDAGSTTLADDEHEDLGDIKFVQLSAGNPLTAVVDPAVAACLVFRPDGATDDAWAIIESADGRRRRITLRGLTGAARVEEDSVGEGA
jgi:Tfp pilus assembly protein FimT